MICDSIYMEWNLAKSKTLLSVAALALASKGRGSAYTQMRGAKHIPKKSEVRSARIFLTCSSNDPPSWCVEVFSWHIEDQTAWIS
jgi:hypothetical protein